MNRRLFGSMILAGLAALAIGSGKSFKVAELHIADKTLEPSVATPIGLAPPGQRWTKVFCGTAPAHFPTWT